MKCDKCSWVFDETCDIYCSGCGRILKRFWIYEDTNCQKPLKCARGDCGKSCTSSVERFETKQCVNETISFDHKLLAADGMIVFPVYIKNTGHSNINLNLTSISDNNKVNIKSISETIARNKSGLIEFEIPEYNENMTESVFEIYDIAYPNLKVALTLKYRKKSKINVWFEFPESRILIFGKSLIKLHLENEGDEELNGDLGSELKIFDEKMNSDLTDFFSFNDKQKSYNLAAAEKIAIPVSINFEKLSQVFARAYSRNQGEIKNGEYKFKFNLKFSKDNYEYIKNFDNIFWYPGRLEQLNRSFEAKKIFENKPLQFNNLPVRNSGYSNLEMKNYRIGYESVEIDQMCSGLIELKDLKASLKDGSVKDKEMPFNLSMKQEAYLNFTLLLKDYKKIKEIIKDNIHLELRLIIETVTDNNVIRDEKIVINLKPEELKIYEQYIGIDFGTSNSCVAYIADMTNKDVQNIKFDNDTEYLESIIYFENGGKPPLIGKQARENSWIKSGLAKKSIKSLLNKDIIEFIDGQTYFSKKPVELFDHFVKYMLEVSEQQIGFKINKFILSVPVTFGGKEKKLIEDVFNGYSDPKNKTEIKFLPEPVAYSLNHIIKKQSDFNDEIDRSNSVIILNVDYGGGTINLAVIRIGKNTATNKLVPSIVGYAGMEKNGGDAIDRSLRDKLLDKFKESKSEKIAVHMKKVSDFLNMQVKILMKDNLSQNNTIVNDCFNLLDVSETIKRKFSNLASPFREAISKYIINSENEGINITYKYSDSETETIKISVKEYQEILIIKFNEAKEKINILLDSCGIEMNDIKWVVLSGQTFKNKDIRNLFSTEYGDKKISYDEQYCKTGVSLGTAIYGEAKQIDGVKITECYENELFDSYGYRYYPENRLNVAGYFKHFQVPEKHRILNDSKLFIIPVSDLECSNRNNSCRQIGEIEILKYTVNSNNDIKRDGIEINGLNDFLFKSIGKIKPFMIPIDFNDTDKTKRIALTLKSKNSNTEEYEAHCMPLMINGAGKLVIPEGIDPIKLEFVQYLPFNVNYKYKDEY